jgi:hypothetical protein
LGKVCNVLDLSFYPKTSIIDQKKPKMSQNRSKLVKNNQKRTILNLPIPCI